jgi:glycosyltransferase involved in cell wall biosynthesis
MMGIMPTTDWIAVVLPTYGNLATLPSVLAGVATHGLPMIVVNDGSTDGTGRWLQDWPAQRDGPPRRVVTHQANRGKAAALLTGFRAACDMGCTHALTFDTDGQLDPGEIPSMLAAARENPDTLILGARDDRAADYPWRSRLGRRVSNWFIRRECGAVVLDSQCGFRVYPLRIFDMVQPRADRYALETEIITLAAWAGFDVRNVRVTCRYLNDGRETSSFRVGRDTLQALLLHGRLLSIRLSGRLSATGGRAGG